MWSDASGPVQATERRSQGQMKTKQQIVSEFRRAAIVSAARSVFARRGFAGGIIDEIAQEAGIAKGTVYLYFRSKTEIYKAVLDHDMKALKQSTLERIDSAGNLRDKIAAFALVRLENAEAQKEFFRIMDSEQENLTMTRSQYRNWLREPVLRLAAAIDDAARRGEIRSVPAEKVAWSIADMTRGAIQRRLMGHSDGSLSAESEFVSGFVWAALALRP
jgi:TetR/AcrR family transcriptional regulator of autoinduction and epiphytic fitness